MPPKINWISGPVCGVNNCPSTFWQVIAGQFICRYGHAREGEIEQVQELEFGETTGLSSQRLPPSNRQKHRESKKESDEAVLKALLYLLKIQAELLVKEKGLPTEVMVC